MKYKKLWSIAIPVALIIILTAIPVSVVLNHMGFFTPEPTAVVTTTAPEDAPELVFVADYDFEPYSYLNDDGSPNGMDVEIAYELANRLGMNPRIEFGTWSECKEKIKSGDADVLLGLEIFVDGSGTGTLKSIPVGTDTLSIIGKDSIDDAAALSGKRVGVSFGSALMDLFKLNCEYVEYFTYSEMLEALDRGDIDYGICHASVASVIIDKNGYALKPSLVLMESFPTMGIRQDEPELQKEINQTLEEMSSDGTITALRDKWIVTNVQNRTVKDVLHNNEGFFILYFVFAIVLLAGYFIAVVTSLASIERKKSLETVRAQQKSLEEALDTATKEQLRTNVLHDIIHSGKWSFFVNAKDEITGGDVSEEANAIIRNDVSADGHSWLDIVHPDDKENAAEAFYAAIKDHSCKTPYDVNYRMIDRDGKYHWYHSAGRMIRFEDGSGEFFGIHVDITSQIEEQLKQQNLLEEARVAADTANKAKTDFLFNMSHDIRTPMNAIIGFTNIAKKEIDNRQKALECLEKVQTSSDILLNLINDVLDMSRIESGKVELLEEKYEITEVFNNFDTTMSVLAASNNIDLKFSIGKIKDRFIYTDGPRFDSVLINIISNAIKYTPAGGFVRVTAEQIEDPMPGYGNYKFTVADNGAGMSEEFQKHMFEDFTREENSTTSGIQGTGLGLSLAKKIVDLMGGTISCVSCRNVGTTFTIVFPFRLQTGEVNSEETAELQDLEELNLKGKKALLVEDNELNREIALEILSDEGIIVETAADGQNAVQMVREHKADYYDFILMDIQMPVMDGYEATRMIHKLMPEFKTPIIALSANAFAEDKAASAAAGMDDHVAKPINIKELFAALAKFIK